MNPESVSRVLNTLRHLTEILEQGLSANQHHKACRRRRTLVCDCWLSDAKAGVAEGKAMLLEAEGAPEAPSAKKKKLKRSTERVPQVIAPAHSNGVNWGAKGVVLLQQQNGPAKLVWRAGYIDSHRGERTYHPAELRMQGINKRGDPDLLGFDFNDVKPEGQSKMSQQLLTNSVQWIAQSLGYERMADVPFDAVSLYEAYKAKKTIVLLDNEKGKS